MTPGGIFDAYDAEITVWGRKDLKDVDDSNIGLAGSPTKIAKASDKVRKGAGGRLLRKMQIRQFHTSWTIKRETCNLKFIRKW